MGVLWFSDETGGVALEGRLLQDGRLPEFANDGPATTTTRTE